MRFNFLSPIIIGLFATLSTFAQAPQGINYQAVIRDAGGSPVVNQSVGIRMSVVQFPNVIYQETHTLSTDAFGLVNLVVGAGTAGTGVFSSIDWSSGPYMLQTEVDVTGGTSYTLISSQEMVSVPYALYAESAGTAPPTHQTGVEHIGASGGLFIVTRHVLFPNQFSTPPVVICTASSQVGTIFDDSFNVTTREVTDTSFVMVVNRVDGQDWGQGMNVHWAAFE